MARNDDGLQELDPAALVMKQLQNMDSESYEGPEDLGDLSAQGPSQGPAPAVKVGERKGSRSRSGKPGGRRYVQMYIPPEVYADLKMAKMAHLLATREDVSCGVLVAMLLEKGLRAVNQETARMWRQMKKGAVPFSD